MVVQTPNGFTLDTGGKRVVVDPVTRIEGHMRCEVNVDENNMITNAVSTGTMWRGLEVILKGRDPRDAWAFTERLAREGGALVSPGDFYGEAGAEYVRVAVVQPDTQIDLVAERLGVGTSSPRPHE